MRRTSSAPLACSHDRQLRMEPLWSPAVARGGNWSQMGRPRKRLKQAKAVAVGCHRLPEMFHGKEGVDGSSPSEGFSFCLLSGCFRCLDWRRPRASASTRRPPASTVGRSPALSVVEQADRVLASVAGEVAVVAVDHGQAGAHVAGEVEGGDAGTEREGREGVPQIVDPAQRLDPGRASAPASSGGCGSCAGRGSRRARPGNSSGSPTRGRAGRARRARSPAAAPRACSPPSSVHLSRPLREGAADVDDARLAVDVALLERDPLARAQPGGGGEEHHRPVPRRRGSRRPRRVLPMTRTGASPVVGAAGCRRRAWPG